MRKILRIARLEWSVLFYSPIAWIIWIIIFVQCGLNYTDTLYQQETQQQLERPLTVVTRVLFAGEKGMLSSLIEYIYLLIPILTMGIFSREYTSGSIKLLQSSPVTPFQIVLGKFLSVVAYAFLIVCSLGLFLLSGYFSVEHFDTTFVVYGLLGVFLLICTYASIGIFMSSLTPYQVVAAISTLAILALFNYAPNLGANYDGFREITNWLAIAGRTEDIVNGLLVSSDILYFLLVIIFFLTITGMHMENKRRAVKLYKRSIQYLVFFGLLLTFGYLSSLPVSKLYLDTTKVHDRTLSEKGQEIAKSIKDPIKITSFVNILDHKAAYGAPGNRIADQKRFEQFHRFIPQMEMEYVVYYDSIPFLRLDSGQTMIDKAVKSAEAMNFNFKKVKTPEQMKEYPELAEEDFSFVRYIEYQGKMTPLRMYDDLWQYPTESEISAALVRLTDGPGVLGLLQGHGERGIEKYTEKDYTIFLNGKTTRNSVINQGFEVQKMKPEELTSFNGVGIIVADPTEAYTEEEILALQHYIDRGGNLLMMVDPQNIRNVAALMDYLGLKNTEGTLMQQSENFDPDLLQLQFTPIAAESGYKFYDGAKVVMNGAVGIQIVTDKGFQIKPILKTDNLNIWNRTEPFDLAKQKITFDPQNDQYLEVSTALSLEREINGKHQKIFVTGDADLMSNQELTRFNINTVNSSLAMRIFRWFSDGKFPVSGPKEKGLDVVIKVDRENINWQKIILLGFVPLIIAVGAVSTLNRRRRK